METASLLLLPVELIHHISRYLSVQDVLSCSLTCHYLRTALNDNSVWKRHLPSDISRLEAQQQQVSPALAMDESLSQLCEYRQHFVRKTYLINNWKDGRFVEHETNSSYWYRSGVRNKTKGNGEMIYRDNYLFLGRFVNDIESDGIEVWNITREPVLHFTLKITDVNYDSFYIVDSYLVVVECIKVFVYQIDIAGKDFLPLKFSFIITEEHVCFNERIDHAGRHDFRCVGWYHSTAQNYLISNKCGENVLHIWDIASAKKVGSFTPPVDSFSIKLNSFFGSNFWFEISVQSSSIAYLLVFDIEQLQFTDHLFSYNDYIYIVSLFKNYVITYFNADDANADGWYDTVFSIFDYRSSLKLKERRFDNGTKYRCLDSIKIVNGRFVILCNDGFHIVDALTLNTIEFVKCDNVKFITKQLVIFESLIVVAANKNDRLELWDVKRKTKLPIDLNVRNVYTSHLFLDKLSTKLVSLDYENIKIVHFW